MDTRRLDVRLLIACLSLVLTMGLSVKGHAQTPPRVPPREITSSNGPFTDDQKAIVKAHAEFWANKLADPQAAPEAVEEARNRLLQPLEKLNDPTPYFRVEYTSFIYPILDPVLKTGSMHAAVNASRVLGEMGAPRAISILLEASNPGAQPDRWQVRQRAADAARNNLQIGVLDPRTINDSVRKLVDSVRNENNNEILRYKFEAMAVASEQNVLQPAEREQIRDRLVDSVVATINRMAANQQAPSPILDAVYAAVERIRNMYIGGHLTVPEQKKIGEKLGPALGKMLTIANTHWPAVQADEQTARDYGNFVQICEEFLKRIDSYVRGPEQTPKTQLQSAWSGKQKDKFDTDAKQWADVLSKAPYKAGTGN